MSNQLNHKLYHFEVVPPSKAWENIVTALNDQTSFVSDQLYNYKQIPGKDIWKTIEQTLDTEVLTYQPIILPFYRRFNLLLKYAAAAALLIVLATAITLLLNKNSPSGEVAIQPILKQPIGEPRESTNQKNIDSDNLLQIEAEREETKRFKARVQKAVPGKEPGKTKLNDYVTIADEAGNKVRLSKKAFTVFNCAENSTSLNYERCKENILLMQQKMSASLLSPSGDFGGLIDMIKSLEENDWARLCPI